jgi:hypothetical protein
MPRYLRFRHSPECFRGANRLNHGYPCSRLSDPELDLRCAIACQRTCPQTGIARVHPGKRKCTGAVEGLGLTKLPAKMVVPARGNAERRSHKEEGIRADGVLRNVYLGEKLRAVSHRYAELMLRIVRLGVEMLLTVGPAPRESSKSDQKGSHSRCSAPGTVELQAPVDGSFASFHPRGLPPCRNNSD